MFRSGVEEVGYITPVIWNERTGNLIDGELRVTEMKAAGEKDIEALVVDVSEEEEQKILALLDKVADLADGDQKLYNDLVNNLEFKVEHLETELKKQEQELEKIERAEYELVPEMLLDYNYVILVFKDKVNYQAAREMFGVDYKIDRYSGKKGESSVVSGDAVIGQLRRNA
jgi:hypothetical protein